MMSNFINPMIAEITPKPLPRKVTSRARLYLTYDAGPDGSGAIYSDEIPPIKMP